MSIPPTNDETDCDQLVEQAKTQREAFAALYDRYFPRIHRYCQRRLLDCAMADDLSSEVFLNIAQSIRRFPGTTETDFRRWAYRIATSGAGEEAEKAQMTETFKIGKGMNFALTLPAEANAHYAGKGVKRQGPKAPVFWYKPAGSQNYRVIFSDLSTGVADAPPEVPGAVPVGQQPAKTPKAK